MKILCTFSGKFGDILWSLPTVRQISKNHGVKVDMGIMPMYKSLVPMLRSNSYISSAFAIDNWFCEGSPFGDQPWEAPLTLIEDKGYDMVYHLTYRDHPHMPLIDYIAKQQGLVLDNPCPFIETKDFPPYKENYVVYAFNQDYADKKKVFLETLQASCSTDNLSEAHQIKWVDITKSDWFWARYLMKYALAFVGCRSANYVLAHGLAQEMIITYEPHPHRNSQSPVFGHTFSNPHWPEIHFPFDITPEEAGKNSSILIKKALERKLYATT